MDGGNTYCDGSKCKGPGEVRVLPTGGDSNSIICRACFYHEMTWRTEINKSLGEWSKFKILKWSDIKPYEFQSEFAQGERAEFKRISEFMENKAKEASDAHAFGHAVTIRSLLQELGE